MSDSQVTQEVKAIQEVKENAVVTELWVFPVKGCRGISLQKAELTPYGIKYDRTWCVVDVKGIRVFKNQMISKRNLPCLATLTTSISDDGKTLTISAPEGEMPNSIEVPIEASDYSNNEDMTISCSGKSTTVASNNDWELLSIPSKDAGQVASDWLTEYLNKPHVHKTKLPKTEFRLVRCMKPRKMEDYPPIFPVIEKSKHDPDYISRYKDNETTFVDFAPFLLTNELSADWLTEKCKGKYPIHSFRANIVVRGKKAFEEETWKKFTVGEIKMQKIKECPRCTVPCRDEKTGKFLFKPNLLFWKVYKKCFPRKNADPEWAHWAGPLFGIYIGHASKPGVVKVGDKVCASEYTTWDAHLPKKKETEEGSVWLLYLTLLVAILSFALGYYKNMPEYGIKKL